jgi:large subunit ribosomal protein L13
MRTYFQKTAETQHDWYIVDAAGLRLGTLAVRVAQALSGKRKPTWTPHIDNGDHVVVINAAKVELGGDKWRQKIYYRHSGYPERLVERAVRGMLPTNRMRDVQLNRLAVYAGDAHPHAAQKPAPLD